MFLIDLVFDVNCGDVGCGEFVYGVCDVEGVVLVCVDID